MLPVTITRGVPGIERDTLWGRELNAGAARPQLTPDPFDQIYRAGRFEDAIRRHEETIGSGGPQDWVFLAMAHHRLCHRDEALRWLDRLRNHRPSSDRDQFWEELEI